MAEHTGGGGASTHVGINYQDYVASWTAVQILAERDVSPPWDLPADVTLETLHAEAPNPIDDLTVETSAGGRALAQAKHTVTLATTPGSPLGSTVAQFVQEFANANPVFDSAKDRFILITSPQSSTPIKVDLPAFLRRLRTSPHPDDEWTAGSQDQQDAARVLREHLSREWEALRGAPPSDADMNALTRLIHLHILDVDPSGHDAQHAKDTLRQCVLNDATRADNAWTTLIKTTGEYAANHQRADRTALQRALTDAGIDLQAQRSYREDIKRLTMHTTLTLDRLAPYSHITTGTTDVVIQRPATLAARTAANDGHLLLIGEPGAGKSGALHELAARAGAEGTDMVLLAVDQLDATSLGALRNELGLDHELLTILDHWPGTNPGYVIIDALDAARTDGAVRALTALIEHVIRRNNRWHVIASVRKFDLRHSPRLRTLFRGTPPTEHADNEFATAPHVNIPSLTDEELAQVDDQAPVLGGVIKSAPAPLRALLRLPFNLRLLAELVGTGVSTAALHPLRTQLELLDRYWQERIIRNDGHGDGREVVLRQATDGMVQRRELRVPRATVVAGNPATGPYLKDLLSTHVLAEWTSPSGTPQHDVLTFPHHLLFDYAVARLSLPTDDHALIVRLDAEPDLLLAIRPSIDLYLQRGWQNDPNDFWTLTFRIVDSPIPEVGKLIAPSVAALHATGTAQTIPLLQCLRDPARHATGIVALQHVLATLLTQGRTTGVPTSGPWLRLLTQASEHLTPALAQTLRPYTLFLTDHLTQLTREERQDLGQVARRLLAYGLEQGNWLLIVNAINAVTATITTDVTASVALLRGCINPDHLKALGYRTLSALAPHIETIATADSTVARDAYIAAFQYRDTSTDGTSMGDSQILPMRSHRKQDYDFGIYLLAQHYPAVLNAHPTEAIDALLTIIGAYVRTEHRPADKPVRVMLHTEETALLPDYSSIWDEISSHDHPMVMLDALQQFLERNTDADAVQDYVRQIALSGPPAVVWRRLLLAAARQPNVLGVALRSLAWDPSILVERDTARPAGQFLKAISGTLTHEDRARVEDAIMAVPTREGVNVSVANEYRDRLLGCLEPTHFATDRAREQYEALLQADGPPTNEEECIIADWVDMKPASHEQDTVFGPLLAPVVAFGAQHPNTTPTNEEVATILAAMQQLSDMITAGPPATAIRDAALTHLAECTRAIARISVITVEQATVLLPSTLAACENEQPAPHENDEPAQPVNGWSPAPRIAGAEAITALARHSTCYNTDTRDAIRRLSQDPVKSVKTRVAANILELYHTDQELMWELVEHWATNDVNPTVLDYIVRALRRLPSSLASRTVPVTVRIFHRTNDGDAMSRVREGCIHAWVGLALWADDTASEGMLDHLIANPRTYPHDLQSMTNALDGYLPAKTPEITAGAFALLGRLLTSLTTAMHALEQANQATMPWPPDAQDAYAALFKPADTVAQRLFFASGASKNQGHERPHLPAEEFYAHAKPLFALLAPLGHPHTTHYLVDTLQHFIDIDPAGVLLLTSDAVTAGSKFGYQHEQLGEGLIVKIVERYLAEFRPLLREQPDCHKALMRILDVFVRVGWPSAHLLTYQLSDIYR